MSQECRLAEQLRSDEAKGTTGENESREREAAGDELKGKVHGQPAKARARQKQRRASNAQERFPTIYSPSAHQPPAAEATMKRRRICAHRAADIVEYYMLYKNKLARTVCAETW